MPAPQRRVERLLPSPEAADLLELARELAAVELAPLAAEYEAAARFPREVFRTLGRAGLLGRSFGGAVRISLAMTLRLPVSRAAGQRSRPLERNAIRAPRARCPHSHMLVSRTGRTRQANFFG